MGLVGFFVGFLGGILNGESDTFKAEGPEKAVET